jgi:hypothetical protein
MSTQRLTFTLAAALAAIALGTQAQAVPTQVDHIDTPGCDVLNIPLEVDEIGHYSEFPLGEKLDAFDGGATNVIPCPTMNNTGIPEVVVEIRNLTGIDWVDVWYIADEGTTLSNYDGEANAFGLPPIHEAFLIDKLGANKPLLLENLTQDGVWENGETWWFAIQDYANIFGLSHQAITSIGVGDMSSPPAFGIVGPSSGSIIGVALVPEPTSAALVLLGISVLGIIPRRYRI